MLSRQDIIEAAMSLVGTPWHFQGRTPGLGVDCAGVLWCTARAVNYTQKESLADYGITTRGEKILKMLRRDLDEISVNEVQPGDVLVFCVRHNGPQHMAILVTDNRIVHAVMNKEVKCTVLDERWASRIVAAFKYKGVE